MIRFLVDQNLSPKTTEFIRNLGWETQDLRTLGITGASDDEIYEFAAAGRWVLVAACGGRPGLGSAQAKTLSKRGKT